MRFRFGLFILCVVLSSSISKAQTVTFETNVGNFDIILNPTNDANLQPLVDNFLAYVGTGRYHQSAINRAADSDPNNPDDDFVLQMGGFLGFPVEPELFVNYQTRIESFDPVIVDADMNGSVDFDTTGLTNTRGTISLALSAGNPNSGTSSFFVNLGNNAFLDSQGFVPFAFIEDMTTIDLILDLDQIDLAALIGQPGNLALSDVPILDNGRMVVVTHAYVSSDPNFSYVQSITNALGIESSSLNTFNGTGSTEVVSVPEPGTVVLAGIMALFAVGFGIRRVRK